MAQKQQPKWQEEVEVILKGKYQGDELSEQIKKASEFLDFAEGIGKPSGDYAEIVSRILKLASEELYPLAAVYAGFQLGVAWERYQNANRTRES